MQSTKRFTVAAAVPFAVMLLAGTSSAADEQARGPRVIYPLEFAVSQPVREMPPQAFHPGEPKEIRFHRPPAGASSGSVSDPVVQTFTPTVASAQTLGQWEGLGEGYPGYTVTAVPPDTNIAVGPNHIVEWVNNAFVVFDKHGAQVLAPVADSTFWGPLSTCNQLGGFSDPIVQYDRTADRWLVGEVALPAFPGLLGQFAQCFAVSTTSDPTGSYFTWAYGFGTTLNDYPKIGMWPDGYYVTWNLFQNAQTFSGPEACAWDRAAMVSGAAAPALVCFKLGNAFASLLPSDWDGATAPPTGSPNFFMSIDPASNAMNLWRFHVDFANINNSTFLGPTSIAGVAPFTAPCLNTQDCIPQPGTTTRLDALGDRLMYRLAYRNLGDHESIVANHTVLTAGGNTAVRWYELRSPNGTPVIYQQGTFAPDADNRWMASIAMDRTGNVGVGYSVASGSTFPSIRMSGWEVGNSLGILQAETFLVTGGGSQTGFDRWGDYSAMRIDPTDDCTFWYAQEYQATTQSANWNTRIASFQFPSCGRVLTPTTTTLVSSLNPSIFGQMVTFTATVSPSTATGSVTFFDGPNSLGTVALSGGSASLSTSTLSVGSHAITATYSGDANDSGSSSSTLTQTVTNSSVGTATSVSSSLNPSAFGQSVMFTATVSAPSGTPTGTVTFFDGTTALGSSGLNPSGVASLSTSTLSAGTHSITAQYGGDGTYTASTSGALSQTVNKANTTTTLTSSQNPSSKGQSVTFTATVAPSTVTGTVQFFDGSTSLGIVALNGGTASLTTSSLSPGSHSISAQYSGDGNDGGSTSAVLVQTVRRRR
jgi:hypothetical protein